MSMQLAVAVFTALAVTAPMIYADDDDDLTPWDQAEVTHLVSQLSEAITSLRSASMNDPSLRDSGAPNRRSADEFLRTLRSLEKSCRQLHRKLEAGDGRDQTIQQARKIGTLLRDAQTSGRRLMTNRNQWAAIDPAVDLIERISPYYGRKTPLLPAVRR
jgi:hypothetical protein